MLQYWRIILILTIYTVPAYAANTPPLPNRETKGAHTQSPNENVSPDHFVALKPFDIPILQDNELKGYLGITLTLEATTAEMAQKIKDKLPRIRQEILIDLYCIMYLLWRDDFTPDIEIIKRYIEKSVEKILGGNYIQAIYTKDFYVRKIRIPPS